MSTTSQLISDVVAAQVSYASAVASKFTEVRTSLNLKATTA